MPTKAGSPKILEHEVGRISAADFDVFRKRSQMTAQSSIRSWINGRGNVEARLTSNYDALSRQLRYRLLQSGLKTISPVTTMIYSRVNDTSTPLEQAPSTAFSHPPTRTGQ